MSISNTEIWSERLRLASLSKQDLVKLGLGAVMVGLVYVMYHLQGNTSNVSQYGRSIFLWMIHRWTDSGDFSHGWIIPFVSIGIVWYKRKDFAAAPKYISRTGLMVVIMALLMHWLGAKAQQARLSLFALILLMWGVPFYLFGWQVAKLLIFPCAYLIFCIPLNFLDSLTFPLRMFVSIAATAALNGLGIAAERSGSAIYSLAAGGFNFDVAAPCSGLRSLLAMTALTSVYAYLTQKTLLKKWILFLSSIPLAIIGNMARIITVALVSQAFGEELALGLYHDYSGYVVFSVAITLMVGFGALLNMDYTAAWRRWKENFLHPTS